MQTKAAAALAIFAVALPLSAYCAAHRHDVAHHAVRTSSSHAAHFATVAADISGHVFHMPRRVRRMHLRAARLRTLRHASIHFRTPASIHFRTPYEPTAGTGTPFAIDNWSAPYYVAYPAPLAGNQPSTVAANPHPLASRTTRDAIGSIFPADSSSRTAPAFESAPVSDPAESPAEAPGVDAVTIVFRDGRPRQQIRNYILTRKTLFIGDDDQPSIPVEQLDLTATIKANEEAGVIFQVPPAIQ